MIMMRAREKACLPLAALCPLMATIPKPAKGTAQRGGVPDTRQIGVLATFYRLDAKRDKEAIRKWDAHVAFTNDTAVKGKSLSYESAKRAATLELASAEQRSWLAILFDVKKLFDSTGIKTAVEAAKKHGFPVFPLVQALIVALAPRRLKIGNAVSAPILTVTRSVIAGCARAMSLARLVMLDPVNAVVRAHQRVDVHQHVYGLTAHFIGGGPPISPTLARMCPQCCSTSCARRASSCLKKKNGRRRVQRHGG